MALFAAYAASNRKVVAVPVGSVAALFKRAKALLSLAPIGIVLFACAAVEIVRFVAYAVASPRHAPRRSIADGELPAYASPNSAAPLQNL